MAHEGQYRKKNGVDWMCLAQDWVQVAQLLIHITAAFWEIIWVMATNVVEQHTASIFRTEHFFTLKKQAGSSSRTLAQTYQLHSITQQKTAVLIFTPISPRGSMKGGEFLDQMSNHQLLAPWSPLS
jgi:hypothetical protein